MRPRAVALTPTRHRQREFRRWTAWDRSAATITGPPSGSISRASHQGSPCSRGSSLDSRSDPEVEIRTVQFEKPEALNLILGQSHFIKTIEDLHEVLVGASPTLKFGVAFCESSGPRLVRKSGNDPELVELAVRNALSIGAGHAFVILLKDGFP